MPTSRLIAIGDVHGCFHALDAVLNSIDPAREDRLVFLGDIIDQGRESRDVLERIIALRRQCRVVLIQGNHSSTSASRCASIPCAAVFALSSDRLGSITFSLNYRSHQ
jgi:hypothetical protein